MSKNSQRRNKYLIGKIVLLSAVVILASQSFTYIVWDFSHNNHGYLIEGKNFEILNSVSICMTLMVVVFLNQGGRTYTALAREAESVSYSLVVFATMVAFASIVIEDPMNRYRLIIESSTVDLTTLIDNIENKFDTSHFAHSMILISIAPILEELFFRKLLLDRLREKYHDLVSVIISSILFSILHYGAVMGMVSAFVFSIIASLIYLKCQNIYGSIIFHIAFNVGSIILSIFSVEYWKFIQKLDFGMIYWAVVVASFIFLVFVLSRKFYPNRANPA